MAIKLGGEFVISRPPEEVYDFLSDPRKFAPLLPGFQGMTQQDETHFSVKVNMGTAYVKGSADVKMELTHAQGPQRAEYKGQGNAAGGKIAMTSGFDLTSAGTGTKVAWRGEIEVSGLLALLGAGIIEPMSRENVQNLIAGLQAALG